MMPERSLTVQEQCLAEKEKKGLKRTFGEIKKKRTERKKRKAEKHNLKTRIGAKEVEHDG